MKRLFWFGLVLALLNTFRSPAQDFSWAADSVPAQQQAIQPLKMRHGLCIVTLTLAGKDYDFLFDTGAPTVLSEDLRNRLALETIGTVRVLDALGNPAKAPVVRIPQMCLSGLVISGTPALVYETANPVFTRLEIQGILGSNALQQLSVAVSHRQKTIRFSSVPERPHTSEALALRLTEDAQGSPFLSLGIGPASETFLFDSGFEGLADLSDQAGKDLQQAVAVRTLHGGDAYIGLNGGSTQPIRTIRIARLQFPNAILENIAATITGDSRSKIGAALFEKGDVTLDYCNRQFWFQPYGQP